MRITSNNLLIYFSFWTPTSRSLKPVHPTLRPLCFWEPASPLGFQSMGLPALETFPPDLSALSCRACRRTLCAQFALACHFPHQGPPTPPLPFTHVSFVTRGAQCRCSWNANVNRYTSQPASHTRHNWGAPPPTVGDPQCNKQNPIAKSAM